MLQSGLSDALLANLNGQSLPLPAPACTYACDGSTPDVAGYVDHIMTSGSGKISQSDTGPGLCELGGATLFTNAIVSTDTGNIPLSTHFGVRADVSIPVLNLSGTMKVGQTGFGYNRATGIWTAMLTVTNTEATTVPAPIQVVINNLTQGVP